MQNHNKPKLIKVPPPGVHGGFKKRGSKRLKMYILLFHHEGGTVGSSGQFFEYSSTCILPHSVAFWFIVHIFVLVFVPLSIALSITICPGGK